MEGGNDDDESTSVIDQLGSEDEELSATEDRMLLDDIIREFSSREREVIRMRFEDGLTQAQIANELGISQVQVSRLLRRTLARIQDKLGTQGVSE